MVRQESGTPRPGGPPGAARRTPTGDPGRRTGLLVLQALEEIEALKRTLSELVKRLEALAHRVTALEAPKA